MNKMYSLIPCGFLNYNNERQRTQHRMMNFRRVASAFLLIVSVPQLLLGGESSGKITQVVNQRNTIGVLSASPDGTVIAGNPITLTYILSTGGAPAPTSEMVQFYDGSDVMGSAQMIGTTAASNLIPFSQVNTSNGWTTSGSTATIAPLSANGPDGSTSTASALTLMDSTSQVLYAVPSTDNYANKQMTFSIYANSSVASSLTLSVMDNPAVAASSSSKCDVSSTWTRCALTYKFPAGSGPGFEVLLSSSSSFGTPINVWGAQFENASQPGGYVSTIGTARPAGGAAGSVALSWRKFTPGSHSVTVQYAGNTNYVGSTSNTVVLTAIKEDPLVVLSDAPAGTSVYGGSVALTATLSDQDNDDDWIPTGTVQFYDGTTLVGTGTLNSSGQATITLVGATSLGAGTHSLAVVYSGDDDFNSGTSSAITHTVTKADSASVVTTTVSSSVNPSVYGDAITLSFNVVSSVGVQPTGSLSVVDGATTLGTVTLDGSGNGTLAVPLFTAGSHSVVATYSGDSNYN
jgi:hypothetical protein